MTRVRNPIGRLVLTILLALGTLVFAMPQAQAAPGVVLCTAQENSGDGYTSTIDMTCTGVGELAGNWNLTLSDGTVTGTRAGGGELHGDYTAIPCTIFVSVTVTVCYVITGQACVNSTCVSFRIVICFTRTVTVCIGVSFSGAQGFGTGTYTS